MARDGRIRGQALARETQKLFKILEEMREQVNAFLSSSSLREEGKELDYPLNTERGGRE